jgi:hypothetical protein
MAAQISVVDSGHEFGGNDRISKMVMPLQSSQSGHKENNGVVLI